MNTVSEDVTAVSIETKQLNGQTITTSNNVQQIKTVNKNT